jgi:predicted Fe-S protein YdhL (DUF1289 family)
MSELVPTKSVPTGAGDYDEVCTGCENTVVEPHTWKACTAGLRAQVIHLTDQLVTEQRRSKRFELLTGTDMGWDDIAEAAGLDRNDWDWPMLRDAVSDLHYEAKRGR